MNCMGFSWHLYMFLLVRKVSQSKSFEISFKIFIDKSKYLPSIWVLSDSNALYSEIKKHRFKNWFEIFGFWKSLFILSINRSMTLKCTMFFIFEGKEIKIISVQSIFRNSTQTPNFPHYAFCFTRLLIDAGRMVNVNFKGIFSRLVWIKV